MEATRDLFKKCVDYKDPQVVRELGIYPYFRAIQESSGSTVVSDRARRVMIGSNNYLGLTHHPRVQEAAKRAIEEFGTGCTGSRFLNGNLEIHEKLEQELCAYLNKEACLVFSTGFLSNQGSLSCLVGRGDVIYSDRDNHASIVEGNRLAIGTTVKFRHNDIEDLERVVRETRDKYAGALIVADGVFSMSGSILDVPGVCRIAQKYDCRFYLDDAHGLGVMGPLGKGTAFYFGFQDKVDLLMGTFSKSFASIGGFVAGKREVIDYIKHKSRPFIFSAAMPPAAVATVSECLKIIHEEPEHLANLWKNARKMQRELTAMGYETFGSQTPIIPLLIGEDHQAFAFTHKLYESGVFATPVVSPAVPKGSALIRTSYMASHRDEDLDFVLDVLSRLGKEFGIFSQTKDRSNVPVESSLQDVAANA